MDLYSEIILDHFKHPQNKGPLADPDCQASEDNPLCGDKVTIYLKFADNKVVKATFEGEGCAISQASTSMLTDYLIGKTPQEIAQTTDKEIKDLLNIPISPGRLKCALLGLMTAKKAILTLK